MADEENDYKVGSRLEFSLTAGKKFFNAGKPPYQARKIA
jgi:hypothetical protein